MINHPCEMAALVVDAVDVGQFFFLKIRTAVFAVIFSFHRKIIMIKL